MNTVPITPDADVLYQTFHLSKKLLELDSIFGVNLINAYLNSYNKEVLVPLLEELIKVHLREIVKKYTPEYMQSEFNEKDHNFYNYANINANINHLYPVLLYGYYGDEYSKYVSFSKDILPYKIDIQEIKDLIRIILSIIYDITFFEYYWAVYQCLTDKSPSLSYWGLLFKKVRQDPKNSGYILSPRYRSKAGFFKFLKWKTIKMIEYNIRLTKEQIKDYSEEVLKKVTLYTQENGDQWYLINTRDIPSSPIYSKEIVIDLIRSMHQALNPELYKSSKCLITEDFLDLAYCMLSFTGLTEKEVFLDDENFDNDNQN